MGSQRIIAGLVIVSAAIVYGSFLLSWLLQKLLMNEVLIRRQMEKGIRHSISRLLHYVLILVGFMLAISTLGFEITKLTIVLSALGVDIGFGLQGVVNNFVSGLILLFELPVRVGDSIEIGGIWSEIKRIGLRATTVQSTIFPMKQWNIKFLIAIPFPDFSDFMQIARFQMLPLLDFQMLYYKKTL